MFFAPTCAAVAGRPRVSSAVVGIAIEYSVDHLLARHVRGDNSNERFRAVFLPLNHARVCLPRLLPPLRPSTVNGPGVVSELRLLPCEELEECRSRRQVRTFILNLFDVP